MYRLGILIASDKGSRGEREDKSGPTIAEMAKATGMFEVVSQSVLPDEREPLSRALVAMCDSMHLDLILTSGGTGFSQRDIMPEVTQEVCERMAPGIADAIRAHSLTITPRAMFSRAVAGIRGYTLIINLPGSPKAVRETLEFLLPNLSHGLDILRGDAAECARQ